MDTTALQTAITDAGTTVGTVAVAILGVAAVVFAFRYVRRALGA